MRVLAINIVTLTNATTEAVITAAAPTLWGDEILAEFQTRLERWPTGYTLLSLTLDAEYLRYLDRVLVEMRHTDRRLLHPRTRNRVLLRSAAIDVIVGTFIAQRESAPATLGHPVDPTDALSGDLGNILYTGLVRRENPVYRRRLEALDVLLLAEDARHLDGEVRRLTAKHFASEDRSFYQAEGFVGLRSAFLEACIVTWMILQGLVAEEAVPARRAFAACDAQERASRRRRLLRWS